MTRIVAAIALAFVLLSACGTVIADLTLPQLELDEQATCVGYYDARASVDECRQVSREGFCKAFPAACDGGLE
ncbi:MAG TPA: hypothetical protein VMI75_21600 [Polyangiaceae bacterium]|nr:hypothetical protein [Polyangiaceae bacterium]